MALWKYYRFDFQSSTGQDGQPPTNSYEWINQTWKQRVPANSPINVSDAKFPIYAQVDTISDALGVNVTGNADINIYTATIPDASTNTIGGKFDNSTVANIGIGINAFGNNKLKSTNIIGGTIYQDTFSSLRFTYDNNSTNAGYCSLLISFATNGG